jgi:hypothetical protein
MRGSVNAIVRAVAVLVLFVSCAGCANTAPSPPSQQIGSVAPSAATWTVSGTVWVAGAVGVEVATRDSAFAWVETGAVGDPGRATDQGTITSDGRYELTIPAGTKRLRLRGPLYQPCAITIEPAGDTIADIYVVRDASHLGAHLPAALVGRGPTLSGQVYEISSGGRRPLANVDVFLDANYGDERLIARTLTDEDGRYVFCSVPFLPGLTVTASSSGFDYFFSSGDLTGRSALDIELRRR